MLLSELLPALYAGTAPVLFIPILVDAYVLPRAALAVGFGGLLLGAGLLLGRGGRVGTPMAAAIGLVAAAAILAWVFSVSHPLSLVGAYSRYESLVERLAYLGLFWGAARLSGGRAARWVSRAFLVGCSIDAVEACYQWASHSAFRPDGNLGQAGLLGALLAMAFPIALEAGLRYRPWLLTLPLLAAGLLAGTSRAGWLAAVIACSAYLALAAPRPRLRRLLAGAGAVAGAAALLLLVASPLRNLNSDTGSARIGVWGDALRMAAARPVTGWGPDATGLVFGRFMSADWEPGNTFDRIHDQPLDLLVTQGALGELAALAMWGLFWVTAWRVARSGLPPRAAGLLGAVAGYECWSLLNFDWAPATGPVFLLAGMAWAIVQAPAVPAERTEKAGPSRLVRAGLSALAVAAGAWLSLSAVLADRDFYAGDPASAAGLDPLQYRYHQALGERLGASTPEGMAELRRAFDLGDYDYSFNVELGDAALRSGDRPLARAAYQRADEVYRFDPTARNRLNAMGSR